MQNTTCGSTQLWSPKRQKPRWQSRRALDSPPLMSTPKAQLTTEQPSIKRLEPTKKDILHSRIQRRNQNKMIGEVHSQYSKIPYPLSGQSTNGRLILSQAFFHRSESWALCQALQLGVWHQRKSPQSIWLWRPAGLHCRSSMGLGEIETPVLQDTHKFSHIPGPRPKMLSS